MASRPPDPLLDSLRTPARMAGLTPGEWTAVLQRARRRALLGKLARYAADAGIGERLPPAVSRQFASVSRLCAYQDDHLRAEAFFVMHALHHVGTPVLFLKGAAYALRGLRVARGRVSSDVDIMVPRDRLAAVERALGEAGWLGLDLDEYDQRYYREWMHELPPLQHQYRATVMDVHHNILPLTGRIRPDAEAMVRDALSVDVHGYTALVPLPADMVVHAAVHLFQDGDLAERLRELLDIHELVTEFAEQDPGFWTALARRTDLHGAGRSVFYAIDFARRLFGTAVPDGFPATLPLRPGRLARTMMDLVVPAALVPSHPDGAPAGAALARWLLLLRSHWLKMPPGLLARHAIIKGWASLKRRLSRGRV
jgi:hypothetical protein